MQYFLDKPFKEELEGNSIAIQSLSPKLFSLGLFVYFVFFQESSNQNLKAFVSQVIVL
ncbi:hypothetical protein SAMN05444394_3177 [Algoriphagus halophilus]|uniref:Uncharacterized protein n=1 Tax=Algoriphagus halophilus TaxID=226505 RepID=A0A1N6GE82_9BACT|nr:hypothetical protein SAMN05444394_3177 [Algoriphagus halophilus]